MILCGNSVEKLKELESESIDCCVTSPPYYGLRDYGTGKWMQIVAEYPSIKKAAEAVGACKENIGFCCRNPNRTCRKYYWRYKESFDADRSG